MRLAIEEFSAMALGSTRSMAELIKSELDFEAATKALQQKTILLQEKDKLIAARDNLIIQKDEDLREALEAINEKDRRYVALEQKHAEEMKSARLTTILEFSTSQLADDCFSNMLGNFLESVLENNRLQVSSMFSIPISDSKWERIDPFILQDEILISGTPGLSNKFEEFRAEVTAHVSEFITAHPLSANELRSNVGDRRGPSTEERAIGAELDTAGYTDVEIVVEEFAFQNEAGNNPGHRVIIE